MRLKGLRWLGKEMQKLKIWNRWYLYPNSSSVVTLFGKPRMRSHLPLCYPLKFFKNMVTSRKTSLVFQAGFEIHIEMRQTPPSRLKKPCYYSTFFEADLKAPELVSPIGRLVINCHTSSNWFSLTRFNSSQNLSLTMHHCQHAIESLTVPPYQLIFRTVTRSRWWSMNSPTHPVI